MFENEGISCEVFNLGYEDVPYKNTELMPMARKPTDFRGQNISEIRARLSIRADLSIFKRRTTGALVPPLTRCSQLKK